MPMPEQQVVAHAAEGFASSLLHNIQENPSFTNVVQKALQAMEGYVYPGLVGTEHTKNYVRGRVESIYGDDPKKAEILEIGLQLANFSWNGVGPGFFNKFLEKHKLVDKKI